MITGLPVVAAIFAALNVLLAWRTFQSQESSRTLSRDMKDLLTETKTMQTSAFASMNTVLRQMKDLQDRMNDRERRTKQERARTAVQTLVIAFRHQAYSMEGSWNPGTRMTLKDDPLGPVRSFQTELGWIPSCDWKNACEELFNSIGPVPMSAGELERSKQQTLFTNGVGNLEPAGQLQLYEQCLRTINDMI